MLSRQSAHQNNLNRFKSYSTKIRNTTLSKPVRQCTNQPIIQPLITPTLRSASGQGERPGGSPGSRTLRRSNTTRWNNFTWLTWGEKCGNIVLSKKCESLSLAKGKSLSWWKIERHNEQKSNLPKAGRHEGLKIPFWRQSTGSPPVDDMWNLKINRWFEWFWRLFLSCPYGCNAKK